MSAALCRSQEAASKCAASVYETAASAGAVLNQNIAQGVEYSKHLSSRGAEITHDAANKGKEIGLGAASNGVLTVFSEQLAQPVDMLLWMNISMINHKVPFRKGNTRTVVCFAENLVTLAKLSPVVL